MIRHILLVKAAADAVPAVEAAFRQIGRVAERLPGVLSFASGPSNSPEQLERGYTHGLVVDFADLRALHGYAVDAEHVAAGALITEAAVGGRDGLLVVDLEVP